MKTVLITGATGFIGQHLVQANLDAGHNVEAFVRSKDPGIPQLCEKGVDVLIGDITNYMAVEHAVNGVDIVYHLAGLPPLWENYHQFETTHVAGMKNICLASLKKSVELLVNVSTCDVFGLKEHILIDESQEYQYWHQPYPDTKIEAAKIAREYSRHGLPLTTVYPCHVYGPGDQYFLPHLIEAIQNKNLVFWRKNARIWPIYVRNLTDFLLTVTHHPAAKGEDFLIHDGQSETYEHFATQIAQAMNLAPPTRHIPYFSALTAAWFMEKTWNILEKDTTPPLTIYTVKNRGSRLNFSIQKAQKLLGWNPPIPYEKAFTDTLNNLKNIERANGRKNEPHP